jgi:ubiquinol-cytochrome c reductase cytochrome b subunit|tara:strand:+ start:2161 stop:3492 length:1332 start_codon:yes stop_codon:yes gene_type:complete
LVQIQPGEGTSFGSKCFTKESYTYTLLFIWVVFFSKKYKPLTSQKIFSGTSKKSFLVMRRLSLLKQPLLSVVNDHLIDYPTPSNLSYWWGFGSLAGICLIVQILTGIFLAMHYTPHVDLAFVSVEHIMRDVNGGWFLRYMHANGASMFFIVVYLHLFRGLYFGSYASPRELVWIVGVVILLLMILTAFIGYVLPWGQMSFWGATVITSLASAIPVVGMDITYWLWGGFSVDNATLNRFFSLHYLLPFIIAGASIVHIAALHQYGSNNPLGSLAVVDKVSFYPYFFLKDLVGWVIFALFFSFFIYFAPNALGHPDNYIPANPMSTPAHIVPEWYFLPVYAILRSIPNKLAGVAAIGLVFVSLLLLPFINTSSIRSSNFRPLYKKLFWLFVADCLLLGWIGCQPVEDPYVLIGQLASVYFFAYFLIFIPFLGKFEKALLLYVARD